MDIIDWLLFAGGAISCLLIAWEDFREREIRWAWFLTLGSLGIVSGIKAWRGEYVAVHLPGLIMIGLMIGLVVLFFRWRGYGKVMDSFLGWGDVVMLIALVLWLEPKAFLLFYVFVLSLTVIFYGLMQQLKKLPKNHPIPLAGILALGFVLYWPVYTLFIKNNLNF